MSLNAIEPDRYTIEELENDFNLDDSELEVVKSAIEILENSKKEGEI